MLMYHIHHHHNDTDSAHLTLSTYAQWSYGDLAAHVLEAVGHNATHTLAPDTLPLALRRSPPLGFVFEHSLLAAAHTDAGAVSAGGSGSSSGGSSKAAGAASKSVKELAAALRAFADVSRRRRRRRRRRLTYIAHPTNPVSPQPLNSHNPQYINATTQKQKHIEARPKLVATGASSLALDFLGGRLPPHPAQLPPKGACVRGLVDGPTGRLNEPHGLMPIVATTT